MSYELIETDAEIQVIGNVFVDDLATTKPLVVDGDLVAHRLGAPSIMVRHGSLICPDIRAETVHADILGVFLDTGIVQTHWTYMWLRPFVTLPDETKWDSVESIRNVIELFLQPELVRDVAPIERVLQWIAERPTCTRSRVLFQFALEELRHANAFTNLGAKVAACFLSHERLPADWRW